jgi:general secretion pathway protein L
LAAQADLDQVLAFEMDRETPFAADEVYWNRQVVETDRQRQNLVVRLLLLPKARLAPMLAALGSAGIMPAAAEVGGHGDYPPLPLDGGAGRRVEWSRRLLWPAAVCCCLLVLSAVAIPFVRQAAALAALGRAVRAGEATAARAGALREQIDRASRSADLVQSELAKAGRPLEILAELTRMLPDDTYLTDFELHHGKLTINGRSAGAARLIGALAANGDFRNPAFTAPVTRLEALHTEVFTIAADVGRPR